MDITQVLGEGELAAEHGPAMAILAKGTAQKRLVGIDPDLKQYSERDIRLSAVEAVYGKLDRAFVDAQLAKLMAPGAMPLTKRMELKSHLLKLISWGSNPAQDGTTMTTMAYMVDGIK